ncbi:MAG TPA: hypothetical protein VF469_05405 [Kofleriaceae bacterium]
MSERPKRKTRASNADAAHAMSLLGADAAAKKKPCKKLEIVITCKPQLVSCDPVTTTPCDPVVIIINQGS